jgi:protein TonB
MKQIWLWICVLGLTLTATAQNRKEKTAGPAGEKEAIFAFVEQMPEFPGGEDVMVRYLETNIRYPKKARKEGITGRVIVKFVVAANGLIRAPEVMRGIGYGCDQEALRVVKSMPAWKPGEQNGRAVSTVYILPVMFKLNAFAER